MQPNQLHPPPLLSLQPPITPHQLQLLLPTPLLPDPFHAHPSHYTFNTTPNPIIKHPTNLTLYFQNHLLLPPQPHPIQKSIQTLQPQQKPPQTPQ
ncbi:outer membrane protein assembly factor BamE domain-containing protein [Neisseria sicca]|uniref:outer membrane protein assembly factor BamE domain-containing protein n=1 Tax=Neisseria sicca TaxID=490 RepID=UPI0028FC2376|nr:outer membrane protein assembly factor BamE [Neisseria sicca]